MLIDAFINAIFLYDDKMVITFNYKEGTKTITFAELQEAISNKIGSDLDCIPAPRSPNPKGFGDLFLCNVKRGGSCASRSCLRFILLLRYELLTLPGDGVCLRGGGEPDDKMVGQAD